MYHEEQLHQRNWICLYQCDMSFPSSGLLKQHMIDHHPGTFTESQLPILLDMCERPADPNEVESCPLCGEEMILHVLRNHVAAHLEDLALFVLPLENDDPNSDADSDHAERPPENDIRLGVEDLSSISSFHDRDRVLCHNCDNEWYRDEHGLTCSICRSEHVEIVSPLRRLHDYCL